MSKACKGSDPQATELNSPACSMHAGEDVYMGYAGPEERTAFLDEIDRIERADPKALVEKLRAMLPRVRDDGLHATLSARLHAAEANLK